MIKALAVALFVLAFATSVGAVFPPLVTAPEVDASAIAGGLGLLAAGLLMIRARSKR